jgi:hypothetical protein
MTVPHRESDAHGLAGNEIECADLRVAAAGFDIAHVAFERATEDHAIRADVIRAFAHGIGNNVARAPNRIANFPFVIFNSFIIFKQANSTAGTKETAVELFLKTKRSTKMSVSSEMRTQSIMLTVPAQIIKEADSLFPRVDLGALTVMLLEKYLRHQKRKLLAQQYRQYYQTLADEDRVEEKQMLTDFAAWENEVNSFIEAEETNGS